ncbi:MAG TPA: hypothetical protein GXX15_09600 [Clostridia bacterium]|nr:hypothetical protein [Clostridia bacterium]
MSKIHFEREWLKELLPEGWAYDKPLLISGPGGSGKPLIGNFFAQEWLKKGGNVIFMTASTSIATHVKIMNQLGCNIEEHESKGKVFYIELEPEIEEVEEISEKAVKANYVKPEIWHYSLDLASRRLFTDIDLGTLVVSASLNLLFFSKTYGEKMYKKLKRIVKGEDTKYKYALTLNSDAFKEWAKDLEEEAFNLMVSGMTKDVKLTLKILKMDQVDYKREEVIVPLTEEIILEIKKEAESGRSNVIPAIRKL